MAYSEYKSGRGFDTSSIGPKLLHVMKLTLEKSIYDKRTREGERKNDNLSMEGQSVCLGKVIQYVWEGTCAKHMNFSKGGVGRVRIPRSPKIFLEGRGSGKDKHKPSCSREGGDL